MTLVMAAKIDGKVIIVSDSRALIDDTVVPPFGAKIEVMGDVLAGHSGPLAVNQFYLKSMREAQLNGEDLFGWQFHRNMHTKILRMSEITTLNEKGEPTSSAAPIAQLILARGPQLICVSSDGYIVEVPYTAIGAGNEVAYNYLYFLMHAYAAPTNAEQLTSDLITIAEHVAATNVSVGPPFFWADTETMGIWEYPHDHN